MLSSSPLPLGPLNILPPSSELQVPTNVRLVLANAFQAVYHLIRLDLGIIRANQMYTSAAVYNNSVFAVPLFLRFAQINGTAVPRPAATFRFVCEYHEGG